MKKYLFLIFIIIFFNSCFDNKKEEIKIALTVSLSGKYSSLGNDIYKGFMLAFDEIGYSVNGKRISIFAKDDAQNIDINKKNIEFFIKNDFKLIVGNATSSMTKASIDILKDHPDILLFSPTASGSEFAKKNDNFIRVQVEHSAKRYEKLNRYLINNSMKDLFFIYDSKNMAHANDYINIFQKTFIKVGGNPFVASMDLNENREDIVKKLKNISSDIILIVGNSVDSANIIQYLRYKGFKQQIICSGWAKTNDFIVYGGKAVEGTIFNTGYDDNSKKESFLNFKKNYKEKYSNDPSVFSAQSYELATILIRELKKDSRLYNIKERILRTKSYQGLQGDIVFDKYGDVSRDYFLVEVEEARFKEID